MCLAAIACGSSNKKAPGAGPDATPKPQCSDGIDNDGDGKIDYPNDPGCFAPEQDDETDDCPDGPMCPECSNGKDDDGNGKTDYPDDPGCESAADNSEFSFSPTACGQGVMIKSLSWNGEVMGMITANAQSVLTSTCGGAGAEDVYLLHLEKPKTVVASTDNDLTTYDTVVYIRGAMCSDPASEIGCNDNVSMLDTRSSVEAALQPGVYFVVVDAAQAGATGNYDLTVNLYDSEGVACTSDATCAPGLHCRIPLGGTDMVCSKPMCSDGVDDDGDGKADYPDDPGCTSPTDNDETDDCPSGPMCPQCGNGIDDDGDGKIDYPMDPQCMSASGSSEACVTSEGVTLLTTPVTTGNTSTATDDVTLACAFGTGGKDLTYQLHVPKLTALSITVEDPQFTFFPDYALFGRTCGGTALSCQASTFLPITEGVMNAGDYYLVVDGDDSTQSGSFQITVSGTIAGGQSCESPLAQSGALTCGSGYTCSGTVGSRTCAPTQCNDGIDNNGDGKIDYPNDPGCTSPDDNTEDTVCPGANCPVCSNTVDDDGDGLIDFPADFGCSSAAGASEAFCALEVDPVATITAATTTGTLANLHSNLTLDCGFGFGGNDKTYVLKLPVPVESLTIDTLNSTITDTILELWDTQCEAPGIACDDDDPNTGTLLSSITATGVSAGNYAVTVQAYDSTQNGAFHLNVTGTVAKGTACSAALFTANVLHCEAGSSCTGTPKKCQ